MDRRKKTWLVVTGIACLILTACGNVSSNQSGEVSGSAVSAGAVSGQAVEADMTGQLSVIAANERVWNMGAEEPEYEEGFYIDSFNYAVTDMDQDGNLEVLTYCCQGTGYFTTYEIYEVDETGNKLIKWDKKSNAEVEKNDTVPDWDIVYPVPCYRDEKTGSIYYRLLDHSRWGPAEGYNFYVDMEISENTIYERMVTYEHYKPDKEHNTEDDFQMDTRYYDAEGKKITEKESLRLADSYGNNDVKCMLFHTEYIESRELKKMEKEELIRKLERSYQGFRIKDRERGTEFDDFEKNLGDDNKKQLSVIMEKRDLGDSEDSDRIIYYAITDFNQNGRLEFVFYEEGQKMDSCKIYEVSESGKKLEKKKEWEELMEKAECGWQEILVEDMYRVSSDYLYEEFVESWRQFRILED